MGAVLALNSSDAEMRHSMAGGCVAVGRSEAWQRVLTAALRVATTDEDLYYRLQVFDIALPPLRERISDVALLAEQFLTEIGQTVARTQPRLDDDARDALFAYDWPGNVREPAQCPRARRDSQRRRRHRAAAPGVSLEDASARVT